MRRISPLNRLAVFVALVAVASVAGAVLPRTAASAEVQFSQPAPMAPGVPVNLTLPGTVSGSIYIDGGAYTDGGAIYVDGGWTSVSTTIATPGKCLRISCTAFCTYRVTAGAATGYALDSDNDLPGGQPERICLYSNQDTLSFWNADGGTAKVAIASGP